MRSYTSLTSGIDPSTASTTPSVTSTVSPTLSLRPTHSLCTQSSSFCFGNQSHAHFAAYIGHFIDTYDENDLAFLDTITEISSFAKLVKNNECWNTSFAAITSLNSSDNLEPYCINQPDVLPLFKCLLLSRLPICLLNRRKHELLPIMFWFGFSPKHFMSGC